MVRLPVVANWQPDQLRQSLALGEIERAKQLTVGFQIDMTIGAALIGIFPYKFGKGGLMVPIRKFRYAPVTTPSAARLLDLASAPSTRMW